MNASCSASITVLSLSLHWDWRWLSLSIRLQSLSLLQQSLISSPQNCWRDHLCDFCGGVVMYITSASASASSLLRASRARLCGSLSSASRTLAAQSPRTPSPSADQCRSLSFSSAVRSLRCSVPRWSHGVEWRSPASLRPQIRAVAPVIERLQRKFATMGNFTLC